MDDKKKIIELEQQLVMNDGVTLLEFRWPNRIIATTSLYVCATV